MNRLGLLLGVFLLSILPLLFSSADAEQINTSDLATPAPTRSETYSVHLPVGLTIDLPTGMRQIHSEAEAISAWIFQSSKMRFKIALLPNDARTPRQLVMQTMNQWQSVSNKTLAEQGDLSASLKVQGVFDVYWMQGSSDYAKQTWGYAFVGVVNKQTEQRFIGRFDWPITETDSAQSIQNVAVIRRILASLQATQ